MILICHQYITMHVFSVLLASFLFFSAAHPLHVSVTEIKYDEKEKELEIMMRVFIDDLEKTIQKRLNQPELDIQEPGKGMTTDQLVSPYLLENFTVNLDGKVQKIQYLGSEKEGEAFIFYILVSNVKKWKTIEVQNSIFQEIFEDQSNLVHVTVRETVRSLRLTREKPADKITFQLK